MNSIYQVVRNDYMAYEYDNNQELFITLDRDLAIEKAKKIFTESSMHTGSERPDFRELQEDLNNIKHSDKYADKRPSDKVNPYNYCNQIFVTETEIGVDLRQKKVPNKVIWSPSMKDIFNNFSMELKALFIFDLNLELMESEVLELWNKYQKDPKVINGTVHYANPINSAYILKTLKSYQEEEFLYELEMKVK